MAKQSITAPSYATNNVSNLPVVVKNQAVPYQATLDKASVDIKAYETNLIAELNGNNGSKKIGHNSLNIASDNVGDAIEEVYQAITSTVLGEIPDNSITNAKLVTDSKVGSLATLTTTDKTSVVGAINEINAYASGIPQDIIDLQTDLGVVETDLNIIRTAKLTTGSNVALAVDTDGTFDMTRNGNTLTIIPNVANTGAMTIAVDGQTARAIQKANDVGTLVSLEAGDIKQNVPVQLVLQTSGTPVFIYAPKGGSNIKSIQSGQLTVGSSTSTTFDVTITSVDTNKSIALIELYIFEGTRDDVCFDVVLLNSTTLRFSRVGNLSLFASGRICWQVVEFNNVKSKQVVSATTTNNNDERQIAITSINSSKSIIFSTNKDTTTTAGSIYNLYVSSARIINGTTIGVSGQTSKTINCQIVEFN